MVYTVDFQLINEQEPEINNVDSERFVISVSVWIIAMKERAGWLMLRVREMHYVHFHATRNMINAILGFRWSQNVRTETEHVAEICNSLTFKSRVKCIADIQIRISLQLKMPTGFEIRRFFSVSVFNFGWTLTHVL